MKLLKYTDFIKELLPENERTAFEKNFTQRLPKSIHIFQSTGEGEWTASLLKKEGRKLTSPQLHGKQKDYHDNVQITKPTKEGLGSHRLHTLGNFYVQEIAAGLPAQILTIKKNDLILDLCAAPGGKSLQILDHTDTSNFLISNEKDPQRRKALLANIERCGNERSAVTGYDGRIIGDLLPECFDKILLDAPCSGEGMQYKTEDLIYHRNEKKVRDLAKLQTELLISALKALKIGGELVYSTCTLNTLENEGVLSKVLQIAPQTFKMIPIDIEEASQGIPQRRDETYPTEITEKSARFRPHRQHTGGFFIAKIQKIAPFPPLTTENLHIPLRPKEASLRQEDQEKEKEIWHFLTDTFEISPYILNQYRLINSNLTLQIIPKSAISLLKTPTLWIQFGTPIFKKLPSGKLLPLQGLARTFGTFAQKSIQELTPEERKSYLTTHSLPARITSSQTPLILTLHHQGKAILTKIKNQ